MERLSPGAQALIRSLKPYKGGNDALWRLHQLDILDKHVILVPVAAAFIEKDIGFAVPADGGDFDVSVDITMGGAVYPLKDGDVVATFTNINPKAQPHVKVQFTIAFGEGRIIDGESVIPTIHQFGQTVDGIIASFEKLPV